MVRDPRQLDQNPVVIDPADVDAVLDDRPTPVSPTLQPPLDEVEHPVEGTTKPAPKRDEAPAVPSRSHQSDGSESI